MYVLGITGFPEKNIHDSSAALFHNDQLIAAAEQERFSRRKHAYGEPPFDAIEFCLNKAGIELSDVDKIAIGWEYDDIPKIIPAGSNNPYASKLFPINRFKTNKIPEINFINHHMTHLTSVMYQSGYEEAAALIVDGQGESVSITLAEVKMGKISIIKEYPVSNSLGAFYDAAAGYTGLGYDVAGKLMGLAPYGIANQKMPLSFDPATGEFICTVKSITKDSKFTEVRQAYLDYFVKNNFPYNIAPFAKVSTAELMSYINFSASVQETLDDIIINLAKFLKSKTRFNNLVLAGGVALNCTANGKLDKEGLFTNIFAYPAANDAGCSVGAALEIIRQEGYFNEIVPKQIKNVYYGESYSNDFIENIVKNRNFISEFVSDENIPEVVSNLLDSNKILCWFQNGFEFGPRALGARSIIANPKNRKTLIKINKLKNREAWRPLSPIVIDSHYEEIFEDQPPYNMADVMLKTVKVRKDWQKQIPAVVHIDGTTRPQLLMKDVNYRLYEVIERFYVKSGIPVIINTSFNGKRQPIVNSPIEAIRFLETNNYIDGLVIGNWLVKRSGDYID